jgi:hypothetical protein
MNTSKVIYILYVIILMSGLARSDLSVKMSLYNSQDDLSVGLNGGNIEWDCMAQLLPDSILYMNGGKSIEPESFYNYEVALNGERVTTGAATDSGSIGWSTFAQSNSNGDGSRSLVVKKSNFVQDGTLNSYQSNSESDSQDKITVKNAAYSQVAVIMPNSMTKLGQGKTLETKQSEGSHQDDANAVTIAGISSVTTAGKEASIAMGIAGDTITRWQDQVNSNSESCNMVLRSTGSYPTGVSNLAMIGQATGVPVQTLPPGEVVIKSSEVEVPSPEKEAIYSNFRDEVAAFWNEHPQTSPTLMYYLNERASIPNSIGESPGASFIGDYFTMGMQFRLHKD